MALESTTRARSSGSGLPREAREVIDTDVHHAARGTSDLGPYLPKVYREQYVQYQLPGGAHHGNGHLQGCMRVDTWDNGDDVQAGAKVERVQSQLLDECGIDLAILTGSTVYAASALSDVDYGSALCRAFNDFTIEHWLAADARFRYCLAINPQDPEGAAAEIDRVGNHAGICGVLLPCGAPRPYGQRFYRPIHEACARHGLPLVLHFGMEGMGINGPPTSAGFPSYYIESRLARPGFYEVHMANLIFEGIFERYPNLKLAMVEAGFRWVPGAMWKMDADWKALRHQTPWVKRLPSEYVIEHCRFSTQPMEEPETEEDLAVLVKWAHGERTLMFASDYPHWDFDHPAQVFPKLPGEIRRRILSENAREAFRL